MIMLVAGGQAPGKCCTGGKRLFNIRPFIAGAVRWEPLHQRSSLAEKRGIKRIKVLGIRRDQVGLFRPLKVLYVWPDPRNPGQHIHHDPGPDDQGDNCLL